MSIFIRFQPWLQLAPRIAQFVSLTFKKAKGLRKKLRYVVLYMYTYLFVDIP